MSSPRTPRRLRLAFVGALLLAGLAIAGSIAPPTSAQVVPEVDVSVPPTVNIHPFAPNTSLNQVGYFSDNNTGTSRCFVTISQGNYAGVAYAKIVRYSADSSVRLIRVDECYLWVQVVFVGPGNVLTNGPVCRVKTYFDTDGGSTRPGCWYSTTVGNNYMDTVQSQGTVGYQVFGAKFYYGPDDPYAHPGWIYQRTVLISVL